ncbi:MAG TPA: hypothetical protein VJH23_01440 [archaeon]|nr:hypothetical protein [archaeon]
MVVFDILSKKKIVPGVTRMDASRDPRPLMDGDIVERPINGKSILGLVNEGIIVPMFTRTELGHVGWERITAEELMKLSHADLALKSTDSSVMNKISANTHRRGIVISKGKPAVRVGKRTISISDKGVVTKIENPALAKKLIAPSLRIFRKAWQTTSPKKY